MPAEIGRDELEEIIRRVQNGSGDDFQKLYHLYSKPIYNFIWRLIGSTEDAEDLTQETFLKVHSELRNLREPAQFRFWLYRIARNEVYQKLRRSQRVAEVSIDDEDANYYSFLADEAPDLDPEKLVLSRELSEVVDRTLREMTPKYRDVFILAVFQKLSYEEITHVVGRSLLSVKTDIYRARLAVKDALNRYLRRNG